MIYSADFIEMAGKINHVNVSKYLNNLGWKAIPVKRKHIEVFQIDENGVFFQVDLPVSKEFRDYKIAMYRCIESIAQSLNKSVEQVILELLNPLSDVLRLRIRESELDTGSIYFEDAIRLYDNAKKLLWATIKDIVSPKLRHIRRAENLIDEFISNCRFGQTEIGSYVVSVVCPILDISNNQYKQLSLFSKEDEAADSITRQVVNKLITSVQKVKESINQGKFEELIHENAETNNCISINFLEALSEINIYRKDSILDISAQYAPTIRKNRLDNASVTIDHNYYDPISTFVRDKTPQEGEVMSFFGRIKRLSAQPDIKTRDSGSITIVFLSKNNKGVYASVNLTKEDYNAAIEAHKDGKMIKIVGVLSSGNGPKTINYNSFEVLE